MTFLAEWAMASGFTVLEADVVEDNARAQALYAKVGFQKTSKSEPFRGAPPKQLLRLALDRG